MRTRPRVLLVRFSSLGDVVLATAAVEALRQDLPGAEVHVLTKPGFREVFRDHPGVTRVLPWEPGEGVLALARQLRRGGYDRIVDLHCNLRTTVLRLLTPGVRWSGYRKGAWRRRLAVWARRSSLLPEDHVVDRYIAALGPLGVSPRRRLPRIYPGEDERARVAELLHGAGWDGKPPAVALAPGARWATKAWPEAGWRELGARLRETAFPVVVGGSQDAALGERIVDGGVGANLAGATSILETAALLERCGALVTNDSAPLHLATAVGTPVVALFGPTVRGFGFFPLGPRDAVIEHELPCRPCALHGGETCPLGHHNCLVSTSADEVLTAVRAARGYPARGRSAP